jgi:hypothetical protein
MFDPAINVQLQATVMLIHLYIHTINVTNHYRSYEFKTVMEYNELRV